MILDLIKNDLEESARTIRLYGNMVASMCWGISTERTYILDGVKYIVLKDLGLVKKITKINN